MTLSDTVHDPAVTPSPTEVRLPRSVEIDRMPVLDLLELINDEDAGVPHAVRAVLPLLAGVVERAVASIGHGGRIHYFGAGTSGRFGVLDAAEVPPTYGVPSGLVVSHMAGGARAMTAAVEDAEDSEAAGRREATTSVAAGDIVFGLAASGHTPYVAGALAEARALGAHTVAVTSNPNASLAELADVHLCVATGPEVVTGSTRMKAGTAQKLVLHSFSTALMVRSGRTFSNLMIDVVPTNEKLRRRVIRLLQEASGMPEPAVVEALTTADGDTKLALVMLATGLSADAARHSLHASGGDLRATLDLARAVRRPIGPGSGYLGVDIGASGYRIVLADRSGVFAERQGETRPTIGADGLDAGSVVQQIESDLRHLRDAGIDTGVDVAAVAIAGGGFFTADSSALARDLAAALGARDVVCMSDAVAAYAGAVGLGAGAVLAAGTGAVAVASDGASAWRRVDGLGHLLGDLGSGAWIGRRALEAAAAGAAGRRPASQALAEAMRRRFGDVEHLVREIYGTAERSALLASFVPDVIAAAEDGDRLANTLLDEAADALADTLLAAARGIDGPIAAVGGLVASGSTIRARLERRLADRGMTLTPAHGSPAGGAAALALAVRDGELSQALQSQLTHHTT